MLYAILGIIQGLTEFLPVSSSGHLVLFSALWGIKSEILPVVIICHLGTLFALFLFFLKDIFHIFKDLVLILNIIIVSLITVIIGLSGKGFFEHLFVSPRITLVALFITAILLLLSRKIPSGRRTLEAINIKDALCLGFAQGLAIIPGISRSGITIFSLLARRVEPQAAFKFSFVAGMPAILGAFLLEAKRMGFASIPMLNLWLAFGMSFLFGLLSLFILRLVVKRLHLDYFGYYLLVVSILGFIFIK